MSTWIVDIDETLALRGERGPYDWDRVGEDQPNTPTIEIVQALAAAGHEIIVVSGRMECCRPQTLQWLVDHKVPFSQLSQLYMRPDGVRQKDAVVKSAFLSSIVYLLQIQEKPIKLRVLDDRDQCVQMWRDQGIFCAQVAPGNF
jgi:hypothetical protein